MIFYFTQAIHRVFLSYLKTRISVGIGKFGLVIVYLLSHIALAQPVPLLNQEGLDAAIKEIASAQGTDAQEIKALLQEFDAMRRTNESRVTEFVTTVATPEIVDRLYRTPGVARLPKSLRENGLIFAGQAGATVLTFDKPSDVIAQVASWFPDELAAARVKKESRRLDIQLFGPYSNWATEPATFMAMWNCTPVEAWLQPRDNPFRKTSGGFGSMVGFSPNTNFGECVLARSGFGSAGTNEEAEKLDKQRQAMNERVVPNLKKKFARFLQANRCRGMGPDDCVLVLHLWASLAADDPELAVMLKSLEPDIALGSPPPAMKTPFDPSNPMVEAGMDRFDEVWRRAAFLRAKLSSILAAGKAWPSDSLRQTIGQVVRLQLLLQEPYADRFNYADMNYRAPAISPWLVLYNELRVREKPPSGTPPSVLPWVNWPRNRETVDRVRSVVLAELNRIDEKADCAIFEPWLTPEVRVELSFRSLERETATATATKATKATKNECIQTDWAWLKAGASADAVSWRTRYLNFLQTASPQAREQLLTQLTDNGSACFGEKRGSIPDWQRQLCNSWIHEPETVQLGLGKTKLISDKNRQFRRLVSYPPNDGDNKPVVDQQAWLTSLAQGLPAQTAVHLSAYAKALNGTGKVVKSATLWRHAGHSRALLELGLAGGDCELIFMLIAPRGLQQINIPQRIWRGSRCDSEIVRVSDLDQDGNLELWWALEEWGAEKFDACAGDDSDLERNLDCSAKSRPAKMAEIDGNILTYFVNGNPSRPKPPSGENWTSSGIAYPLPTAPAVQATREPACNRRLIESVLSEKLWVEEEGRQTVDLACARHPANTEQTIVALFYEPEKSDGVQNESQVGFAVAVIDIRRKQVLRMYKSLVEEDATTRIRGSSGGLGLDTARYILAPNVRAFGVRMNTQYSPRYAEGGSSDYLTLFVEEGKKLRPVLSELAMRSWTMIDSSGCFDQPENSTLPCLIERQTNALAVSSTSTHGWQDLELITTTTQEGVNEPGKRAVTSRLRYKQGGYQ